MNIRERRTYLLGLSKDNLYFLCGALHASKATSPEEQAANLFSAGSWPWDGWAHLQCWCCSLNLFWEMSPRTHRLAPRTYSGLPSFPFVRKKTSFAKVRVYASLSHLSRGEMSKDGTQQVPPFELSPLRVNVARGQQGLERYFSLASSTLLRSNTS